MHRAQPPLRTPLLPDLSKIEINEYKSKYPNQSPAEYLHGNDEDKENNIINLKNRIELRRMLAAYESGNLKPSIYYKNSVFN